MPAYSFEDARALVIERVRALRTTPKTEMVGLIDAAGRVLMEEVRADRNLPPVARSVRDGFAVRSANLPGTLHVIGEVRAGGTFIGAVGPGQAVEIMTGAPVPNGADQIVMVEHVTRDADRITTTREGKPGEFINPAGAECKAGDVIVPTGTRMDFVHVAALAMVGATQARVFRRPKVAILSTGDEVIPVEQQPTDSQVRNSNAWSLAAQVKRAGGDPILLPAVADDEAATRHAIEEGLKRDLLLLSGGVSAGKYDYVEPALAALGAEFYFDRVLIQPGQPLVFGRARDKFFFGLPGNPASTMATFELYGRAALDLLAGATDAPLPLLSARLAHDFRHKPGLTRFLPARLHPDGLTVELLPWAGSSDIAAMARANAYLIAAAARDFYAAGEWIQVIPR
ncbi:MAG: gephyrin-like molybdotransferase Glp [Acidobacteriota bacterium]